MMYTENKSEDVVRALKKQENCNHEYKREGTTPFKHCEVCGKVK